MGTQVVWPRWVLAAAILASIAFVIGRNDAPRSELPAGCYAYIQRLQNDVSISTQVADAGLDYATHLNGEDLANELSDSIEDTHESLKVDAGQSPVVAAQRVIDSIDANSMKLGTCGDP